MNRTDRLLAILIELQRRQTVTAQSLAEKFETSIRTIYRDMDALNESGVPIYSMPGHGYSLMDGYFLPHSAYAEEAVTLLLGGDYIEKTFTSSFSVHARSAKRNLKLFSLLINKKAQELRETFRFLSPIFSHQQSEQEKLENQLLLLQESIQKNKLSLFLSETERNYKNKADRSSLWLSQYFRNLVHRCPLFTSKTNTQFSFRSNGYITARTRILYKAERFFFTKL